MEGRGLSVRLVKVGENEYKRVESKSVKQHIFFRLRMDNKPHTQRLNETLQSAQVTNFRWVYLHRHHRGLSWHIAYFLYQERIVGSSRRWHRTKRGAREEAAFYALPVVLSALRLAP